MEMERQKGKEEVLRVQVQTCTIQSLVSVSRTHTTIGNTGASKTVMSGTKNDNTNVIMH